jgi:hypothetical protein
VCLAYTLHAACIQHAAQTNNVQHETQHYNMQHYHTQHRRATALMADVSSAVPYWEYSNEDTAGTAGQSRRAQPRRREAAVSPSPGADVAVSFTQCQRHRSRWAESIAPRRVATSAMPSVRGSVRATPLSLRRNGSPSGEATTATTLLRISCYSCEARQQCRFRGADEILREV